jgi:hypothetical protein
VSCEYSVRHRQTVRYIRRSRADVIEGTAGTAARAARPRRICVCRRPRFARCARPRNRTSPSTTPSNRPISHLSNGTRHVRPRRSAARRRPPERRASVADSAENRQNPTRNAAAARFPSCRPRNFASVSCAPHLRTVPRAARSRNRVVASSTQHFPQSPSTAAVDPVAAPASDVTPAAVENIAHPAVVRRQPSLDARPTPARNQTVAPYAVLSFFVPFRRTLRAPYMHPRYRIAFAALRCTALHRPRTSRSLAAFGQFN